MKILIALIFALSVIGCSSTVGHIVTDIPSKAGVVRVEVTQPDAAILPASVVYSNTTGEISVSTGSQQEVTTAMIAAENTWIAWIVGPLLILIGIGLLAVKKWLPILPTTAGTYTIAAGAGVMALAIGLPSLPVWVWVLAAIGLGLYFIVPGMLSNNKQLKKGV